MNESKCKVLRKMAVQTCVCVCLWVCVYVCVAWSVSWWGGLCPGGLKGMQVARSAICHATVLGWYLTTCSVEFKYTLGTHTHTHMRVHTHAHTHPPTYQHTQMYTNTQAWRVEMKYPPHQPHSETWRPRPGDRDRTSDHMTLGYRGTPVLFVLRHLFLKLCCDLGV